PRRLNPPEQWQGLVEGPSRRRFDASHPGRYDDMGFMQRRVHDSGVWLGCVASGDHIAIAFFKIEPPIHAQRRASSTERTRQRKSMESLSSPTSMMLR